MKLSLLFFALAPPTLVACAAPYSNYVATDGTLLHDVEPGDALRVSAARDLGCAPSSIHVFQLADFPGGSRTSARIRRGVRSALEVADGCGQRVVYREDCGMTGSMLPQPATEDEARKREWRVGAREESACRHLLVSRVSLDPRSARGTGQLTGAPSIDSLAAE